MKHKKLLILTIIAGTFVQELAYSEVVSKKDSYYFPYISGSLLIEEKYDRLLDGNNGFRGDKKDLLFTYVNTNININFTNYFSLGSRFILRPTEKRNNLHIYNDFYGNEILIKRDFYERHYKKPVRRCVGISGCAVDDIVRERRRQQPHVAHAG